LLAGERRLPVPGPGLVQPEGGKGTPYPAVLLDKPTPANLKVTQAAVPMRIDPAPEIGPYHLQADTGKVERSNRQHKKQALQRVGGAQFAGLLGGRHNVVTAIASGTCTLVAAQAGNGSYGAAASVSRNFTVERRIYLPLVIRPA